jgi:hypothetical protein
MDKNYENALKVIEGFAGICQDNKDFAAAIVRSLAGEVKPEPVAFQVGDIVEALPEIEKFWTRKLAGKRGIVINAEYDMPTVEFFENIDGHDDYGGKPGHVWNCQPRFLRLVHRPSLSISPKS